MPYDHIIAVTNRRLCSRPFDEQLRRVCSCHPKALILREKDLTEEAYTQLAGEVLDICRSYDVTCILHTYPGAARRLGCRSIHMPLPLLRSCHRELSGFDIIGTSVHSPEEALEGETLGATYLTAGHIYATDCKKGVPPRGTDFLRKVCRVTALPVYAIGGIRPDGTQIKEILDCGARGGCIMSGMMRL